MIYTRLQQSKKQVAVLIDPDKQTEEGLKQLIKKAQQAQVDFFLVGGSLLLHPRFEQTVAALKSNTEIPVIIFPGSNYQISNQADAILFLSLISGRNAEYLIGQQVVAAPLLRKAALETIACGYILIDGGRTSATAYLTQTAAIPRDKPELAVATAMAGEMLGMKLIYVEAGSGAAYPADDAMIAAVKKNISVPLVVGGGIRTAEQAEEICRAGADIIVIGNVLEKEPGLLMEISLAVHSNNKVRK